MTGASVDDLKPGLIALGLLVVPAALFPWLDTYLAHIAAFKILADIRGRVYNAYEALAPGYLLRRRSGDLAGTAIADVELLERFYAHTISPVVVAATVPGAATVALAFFHPVLALVLVPVLLLLASIPFWLRRRALAQGDELRRVNGRLAAEAVEEFQGLRELVVFGARERTRGRFAKLDATRFAAKRAHARRSGIEHAATDVLSTLGLLAVLVASAGLVTSGRLEPALFPVVVVLAATTFSPVLAVVEIARELNIAAAAAARVMVILDAPVPVRDLVETSPPGPVASRIEFRDVRFAYAEELPEALRGVSFTVEPGETVALVGHSGAGKSTCAHLLMRFWDVTGGSISIGGIDLRDFRQEDLRALLTYVPQDVFLFNASMADNIRLGRPDAPTEVVVAAAMAAQAHEFLAPLPDGYDTVAGELGSQLSGGQRQRIAIARALLTDADILLLDEAVSNLDAESELALAEAVGTARVGRTTLVIAHRLSTIRAADRVVVLDGGQVAEIGTHDELMDRQGVYARLIASQLAPATAAAGGFAPPHGSQEQK